MPSGRLWCCFPATDSFGDMIRMPPYVRHLNCCIFLVRWRHTDTLAWIWRFEAHCCKCWDAVSIFGKDVREPDQWRFGGHSSRIFWATLFQLMLLLCFSFGNVIYVMWTINFENWQIFNIVYIVVLLLIQIFIVSLHWLCMIYNLGTK